MSTVSKIKAALEGVGTERRPRVKHGPRQQCRQRGDTLIYHDSYGVVTEADLIVSAEDAFLAYGREEVGDTEHRAR